MSKNRMEIDSSSFNNQLLSTINHIDLFHRTFKDKYNTNDNGKMNFLRSYTSDTSVFRQDILDDSKNILDILREHPPINLEGLKKFLNDKKDELQSKNYPYNSQESTLVELIKKILSKLENISSDELKENTNASFGK